MWQAPHLNTCQHITSHPLSLHHISGVFAHTDAPQKQHQPPPKRHHQTEQPKAAAHKNLGLGIALDESKTSCSVQICKLVNVTTNISISYYVICECVDWKNKYVNVASYICKSKKPKHQILFLKLVLFNSNSSRVISHNIWAELLSDSLWFSGADPSWADKRLHRGHQGSAKVLLRLGFTEDPL